MIKHAAYIGLGSNLDNPAGQIEAAVASLKRLDEDLRLSPLYQSKAVGPGEQPDYINAVARLETPLSAEQLLVELQSIEHNQHRIRQQHWGPRTIDLDILLFDDLVCDGRTLCLPHPQMTRRNFVIYPLYDLAPDLVLPGGEAIEAILNTLSPEGIRRLEA